MICFFVICIFYYYVYCSFKDNLFIYLFIGTNEGPKSRRPKEKTKGKKKLITHPNHTGQFKYPLKEYHNLLVLSTK